MALGYTLAALLAMAIVAVYFAPTLIALGRHAADTEKVLAVNALVGWTVLGWLAAMLLAVRSQPDRPGARTTREMTGRPYRENELPGSPGLPDPGSPRDPSLN